MPGEPSSERQDFIVDGFHYILVMTECGAITLSLTDGYIPGKGFVRGLYEEHDPFERWEDYNPEIRLTQDIPIGVNAFKLIREVRRRIRGWISRIRPSYFSISPGTDRKSPVFDRICELLARHIKQYSHQRISQTHYFYRLQGQENE